MYENPPPPEDYVCDFEKITFFALKKPQSVPDVNFINIDRSLIHKKLLGYEVEGTPAETVRKEENLHGNENIEGKPIEKKDRSTALEEEIDENVLRNVISNEELGRLRKRMAEVSVKQEILSHGESLSDKEETFSSSFPKKAKNTVKKEVLFYKDDVASNVKDDVLPYKEDKKSTNYSKNQDDLSADDYRSRHYDDSNPYMEMEMNQEILQEPESASLLGPNDFYCKTCKLLMNNEPTYNSHLAGKRHKKAVMKISELEVVKLSVAKIKKKRSRLRKFFKPPNVERVELPGGLSKIHKLCEDPKLLIVGLDFVTEIIVHDEAKYYCDLCDAQCVENTIMDHLTGSEHQMNYLRNRNLDSIDSDNQDRRVEGVLKDRLMDEMRLHERGRIRVFADVPRHQSNPVQFYPCQPSTSRHEPFNPQPSTSRQCLDVQVKKRDGLKITDEDYMSRDYSDFYCKICDSHMGTLSMWESHARGKKHVKKKKEAPGWALKKFSGR